MSPIRMRRLVVLAAIVATTASAWPTVSFAAQADWRQFHNTTDRRGVNPSETLLSRANVGKLRILWRAATGRSKEGINSSPAVVDGIAYVGSDDGRIHAFGVRRGALIWSRRTGAQVRSSPAVAGGVVYVGSSSGKVLAFKAATGRRLWTRRIGGNVTAAPLVVGEMVFIGSRGGRFLALRASSGRIVWRRRIWSVWASAAYSNGIVYVGSDQSMLFAFSTSDGTRRWVATVGDRIRGAPAVANGRVFVGADNGKLYAFDSDKGTRIWSARPVPPGSPGVVRSTPAVADGLAYVTTGETGDPNNGRVAAFATQNGARVWRSKMADYSTSSPALANGVLYAASYDTRVYAYNSATGARLWATRWRAIPRGINSSPAVVNGRVFVGSRDGRLYAFGLR